MTIVLIGCVNGTVTGRFKNRKILRTSFEYGPICRGKVCRAVNVAGNNGVCLRCGARLRPARRVTAAEAGALREAFWRMVKAGDSFRRSNPKELRE